MCSLSPGEHPWLLSEPDSGVEVPVTNTGGQADRTLLQSLISGMTCFITIFRAFLSILLNCCPFPTLRLCPQMERPLLQELEMRHYVSGMSLVRRDAPRSVIVPTVRTAVMLLMSEVAV